MVRQISLAAKAFLLLASQIAASPVALNELLKRDPPRALPENASADELKWQPVLDFDTDSCYNTPAIDANSNIATGLSNHNTGAADDCRDKSDLDNNNVYVRRRCNNGWCAYLYDYYFEKDVAIQHVADAGGHRHDWEHVAVFVQNDVVKTVATSAHGDYTTKYATDDDVRFEGTHPKIVYHKDSVSTHAFRFANPKDDKIENARGVWFRGALVSWNGFPSKKVRDDLVAHDFGKASFALGDESFASNLAKARAEDGENKVPGFDSGLDA